MLNELSLKPKRRQKLKLTFDQLEQEMELEGNILSTPMDLSAIAGGSSINDYISYFESLGFTFTQDANGNYYSGSYMWLDPVTVTAHYNSSGGYGTGSYVPAWDYGAVENLWGQSGFGGGGGESSNQNYSSPIPIGKLIEMFNNVAKMDADSV